MFEENFYGIFAHTHKHALTDYEEHKHLYEEHLRLIYAQA